MKKLNVLLLGWGKMGSVEGKAILSLRQEMEKENRELNLVVVERMNDRLEDAKRFVQSGFPSYTQALDSMTATNTSPEIIVMAFNDVEHFPAFKNLLETTPSIKAVFSEKPLAATQEQAECLYPFMHDKFVTLDTIINFSPVFDALRQYLPNDMALTHFDCFWRKDRTKDTRPSTGIVSDIIHPLGIVSEMFKQGAITLMAGTGYQGYLSDGAKDVVYEIDTRWMTDKKIPVTLQTSYAYPKQQREVIAYYKSAAGETCIADLQFDVARTTDRLVFSHYASNGKQLSQTTYTSEPDDVQTGYQGMVGDRVSAFIGWSFRAYLKPDDQLAAHKISNLESSRLLQNTIEQIRAPNAPMVITQRPALSVLTPRQA
ncbi:MAG: Gfo/Idh/MocA family oxidoreductase [Bdellovibrionales bacterium]|jgi:hypothetical protein